MKSYCSSAFGFLLVVNVFIFFLAFFLDFFEIAFIILALVVIVILVPQTVTVSLDEKRAIDLDQVPIEVPAGDGPDQEQNHRELRRLLETP